MTSRYLTLGKAGLCVAITVLLATQPALAADLFATGKQAIKETAGDGSAVEVAMLGSGALGAAVTGFTTRNWFGAIGGFAGGMIFWSVAAPLVGLA
uniref:Pilin n=1 Tax=Vibrio genomosp. F6 TaxID=723172 RepID=A0A0H3ZS67_9VIBR|nr:IncF plasmid conjugative transfer pilin protein TraA [Vibrio genomosp. F6]